MDFIITWVDGNDPDWQKEYLKYKKTNNKATHAARFRQWDNLHYWFRGVEKFAPWVDKIHFVTWGHLPKWLNTKHPKLNIVRHEDYIPKKYLPTFNSHTIELNFHRIAELSNNYVYFNDDIFLINQVKEEDFFKNGLPCDMAISLITRSSPGFFRILHNNLYILNKHNKNKRKNILRKPFNWFNFKYGPISWRNLSLALSTNYYTGFQYYHLQQPFLKSTLAKLWEKEFEIFDRTCSHKFRDYDLDINSYLQRYWELATNNFYPINIRKLGSVFRIFHEVKDETIDFIKQQKKTSVCINDYDSLTEKSFLEGKQKVNAALDHILPEKSGFEN